MTNYWNRAASYRIGRRRALASVSGVAASALFLAACGGSDNNEDQAAKTSGLLVPVVDETKSAKRGGIYLEARPTPATLDPHSSGGHVLETQHAYSSLFRIADGLMKDTDWSIEPELMSSWEISPDKLTVTAKLSPNAKFGPTAPVSGRAVTTEDILFSWKRFGSVGSRRAEVLNSASPDAPVVSLTAPDSSTIVIQLKEPNATALALLGSATPGAFCIVPKEAESTAVLDLRNTQIGSGPFYMSNIQPSVGMSFRKNPGFNFDKEGGPFIDGVDYFDVSEYAALLAQFKAGALWYFSGGVRAEDIFSTKDQVSALELMETPITTSATRGFFGQLPESPFKDERVRQAWTKTWDRDLFNEAVYNVAQFKAGGLEVETAWSGAMTWTSSGWYIDPKSKDFGPNSKFFEFDLAESKKLLAAAGFPNGVDTTVYYATTFPAFFYTQSEMLIGMVRDSNLFRPKIQELNYATEWNTTFRQNRGKFNGVGFLRDTGAPDPVNNLVYHYHQNGGGSFGGDATMDEMLLKAQREFDTPKRMQIAHDIQRYEGQKMFNPLVAGASGFALSWPAERNKNVWIGGSNRNKVRIWIDPTKAPMKG